MWVWSGRHDHARKETFLIAEQLQAARAAHWRQKQSPILTLEDAESWLQQHPLCLYLPRQAQLPAPAPSFVEACMGSRQAMPGAAAIEQAHGLLTRLIASGTVVPLNLLGTVSEQPDFLAHSEALPFVLALRADPDWKHAPQKSSGHKVSPLVLELWRVLDKEGALTAAEARETLGRELTEAAVLRALCELWQALRITPVLAEAGQPARWEMLRVRHRKALETGSTTSQVTALSLLVSMYLQSVFAASSEEIEIFLSPVASRSRVREAVRGLSATRQIHTLSMDAQTYYFLENGLPEFAGLAAPSAPAEAEASLTQRPRPRKIQATARPDLPAALPSASAPIFRRTKPDRGPAAVPPPKPAAAQPAASAGWKTPARPGRPAWKPAASAPARGARWAQKDNGPRDRGKPRPASGSRPPSPPARGGTQPYARPAAAPETRPATRPETRPETRPDSRDGARRNRPGAWSGAGKRERPAPWALPGRKSGSASHPPRAGGRGNSPFRPAQKQRPGTAPANAGAAPFPPRAARGERGPGDPSRMRSTPGRPQDRTPGRTQRPPSAYGADRSPVPYRSNQARSGQARSGQGRSGPAGQGGRPSGGSSRSGPARFDAPRFDASRSARTERSFPRAAGPRPASPGRAGRDAHAKTNARGTKNDRPRPAGYARPGAKPGPGGGGKGRGDRGSRPPFVPGSKPWPRAGRSSANPGKAERGIAKPGKPPASFRGRKPDRKKPGA
jgi:23S rRNA pseudouridine2605 synthase